MNRRTSPPATKAAVGQQFPDLQLTTVTDESVTVPDPGAPLTHLQFRRFAGCPICNLHLQSISTRLEEISGAGIREVVVFHSTPAELRKYQEGMPFPVIGDPEKELYRRFGVEASPTAILRPGAWRALPGGYRHAIKTAVAKRRAPLPAAPTNGNLGLPAEFLISAGRKVKAVKYGRHAYDQWTVDELLTIAGQLTGTEH
jgi:peroxiredoxin